MENATVAAARRVIGDREKTIVRAPGRQIAIGSRTGRRERRTRPRRRPFDKCGSAAIGAVILLRLSWNR